MWLESPPLAPAVFSPGALLQLWFLTYLAFGC